MVEKNPRIQYLCSVCMEWSSEAAYARSPLCPLCKHGRLEKRCAWCTFPLPQCTCQPQMLDTLCQKCGVEKEHCICLK